MKTPFSSKGKTCSQIYSVPTASQHNSTKYFCRPFPATPPIQHCIHCQVQAEISKAVRLSQIMKVSFRYLHAWPDNLGLFHYYYQSLVWQNNNIAVQSGEVMKQSTDITVHNHIGLQHSSWSSSLTYSHCNHFSLSVAGAQTLSVIHNKDTMLILCSVLRVCTLVLHYYVDITLSTPWLTPHST